MGVILKEMGVIEYEFRVVNVMLEFVYCKIIVVLVWYWNWVYRWNVMYWIVIFLVWKIMLYDFIDKLVLYLFYFLRVIYVKMFNFVICRNEWKYELLFLFVYLINKCVIYMKFFRIFLYVIIVIIDY